MKLYYSENLNPRVAVAAARHLRSPVEFVRASPRHPEQVDAFTALNPNALVPILVDGDAVLWETDAIVCRLSMRADSDFWRSGEELPDMIRWLSWSAHHLNRAADPLYFERVIRPTFSDEPVPAVILDEARADFLRCAGILDGVLAERKWLVGGRVSYADFRAASALPFAAAASLPVAGFVHLQRWHDQLLQIDAWRAPFDGLLTA